MTVFLIRHGQTQGNLERRYVSFTDEPLCPQGREALKGHMPPEADYVYTSPMRRCRETAALLYPGTAAEAVPGLEETNFGAFEGHTYEELKNIPSYQTWLDSGGTAPPPGGEGKSTVRQRILSAFTAIAARHGPEDRIALVIHGGTIMMLLETLEPSGLFYHWQASNGGGFRCRWKNGALTDVEKL